MDVVEIVNVYVIAMLCACDGALVFAGSARQNGEKATAGFEARRFAAGWPLAAGPVFHRPPSSDGGAPFGLSHALSCVLGLHFDMQTHAYDLLDVQHPSDCWQLVELQYPGPLSGLSSLPLGTWRWSD